MARSIWHAYLAVTLDGRIARPDGSFDFLDAFSAEEAGFETFFAGVDALVMGRRTYDAVRTLGPWSYGIKPVTVLSSAPLEDPPAHVARRDGPIAGVIDEVDRAGYGRVWLVGGGVALAAMMAAGRLDLLELWVVPLVLGPGIPLFPAWTEPAALTLVSATPGPQGMARLLYRPEGAEARRP